MDVGRGGRPGDPAWADLIPPDARVVLLAGCSEAVEAEAFRRRHPTAFVVGIDGGIERSDGALACLDRAIATPDDALSGPTPGLAPGSVDALVFCRPIDRSSDARRTLDEAGRLLAPGGVLLAHAAGDEGRALVGDRWRDALARSGLTLVEVEPWGAGLVPFDDSPPGPASGPSGPAGLILQAVRKGRPVPRLRLQTLAATPICSRVRTEEPDRALRTIPGVRTRTDYRMAPLIAADAGEVRVLVRQRNILGPRDLDGLRALRRSGYLIVCEWDDDPAIFPEIAAQEHLTFRACHAVQTSTGPLAALLRDHNPEVAVFPNRVAELPPPRPPRADDDRPVTIVFAALNRGPDWADLMPALRRVLADSGGDARVEVVHDRDFFDALAVPPGLAAFRPFLPYDQYVALLRRSDVALLPLAPSRFNRCKSDLKFLECAANGVACLASPTVYEGSIRHGETGLIYRSAAEFEALLRRLIADGPLRRSIADAAYREVALDRMLGPEFRRRYHWYLDLARRRPALDRALCDRVPELA